MALAPGTPFLQMIGSHPKEDPANSSTFKNKREGGNIEIRQRHWACRSPVFGPREGTGR